VDLRSVFIEAVTLSSLDIRSCAFVHRMQRISL